MYPQIVKNDWLLEPYLDIITSRTDKIQKKEKELCGDASTISDFANGYKFYGMHREKKQWVFREYAPNATAIYLIGDFNNWQETDKYQLTKTNSTGDWEIKLPLEELKHKDLYKLAIHWNGGKGMRIPSYANRAVQDEQTKIFTAQVWCPEKPYQWKHKNPKSTSSYPLIYEAHVGMATEEEKVGTYKEFTTNIIPKIAEAGYNVIQLMAIQEHPYYGSFGYHVSNYFAASSRFGTPDELKELIDTAHSKGIAVIMDIVHSHSVRNVEEGLGEFDGNKGLYFHSNHRREHVAWDSLCFDYGNNHVAHFLLSNCKYWLDEYNFDGYRFDGVTSMLYYDHGLERDFNNYNMYFDGGQDIDAIVYLALANKLIHQFKPTAITIAEDMSGMPGLASSFQDGGIGFDYRLAMGVPDYWIKLIKEFKDENWHVGEIFHQLTSKRKDERVISYAESHDQALVGDKTIIFRLIDAEMYTNMSKTAKSLIVDRGMALHKMIRLITLACSGGGYLNFMGNEFGHPEWIDFPREGNGWSYKYARRQWSLTNNNLIRYHWLADFDETMIALLTKNNIITTPEVYKVHENTPAQVLAVKRNNYLFVFNFNPTQSFVDYSIRVEGGKYKVVLNTDNKLFGGFGHVDEKVIHQTIPEGDIMITPHKCIKLYLPARTALVLEHKEAKSVY